MARDYPLYSNNTTLGWSIVRRISYDRAESLVSNRRMRRVVDGFGAHLGYQMLGETDKHLPSRGHSSCAITALESEANAGVFGPSLTIAMCEEKRIHRLHSKTGKCLRAEDFIELAQAKVNAQTLSMNRAKQSDGHTGDRAVRVYPREAARG